MKRTIKKGPSVRSLEKENNALRENNHDLRGRLFHAKKVESIQIVRTEIAADTAVSATVKTAEALGCRVYVTIGYNNALNYVAEKQVSA